MKKAHAIASLLLLFGGSLIFLVPPALTAIAILGFGVFLELAILKSSARKVPVGGTISISTNTLSRALRRYMLFGARVRALVRVVFVQLKLWVAHFQLDTKRVRFLRLVQRHSVIVAIDQD